MRCLFVNSNHLAKFSPTSHMLIDGAVTVRIPIFGASDWSTYGVQVARNDHHGLCS